MKKEKQKNLSNKIAMISVTFVVGVLFIALMAMSSGLKSEISGYEAKNGEITSQIQDEEKRTQEIDELKDYMQSDEYAQEVARDKLGLVKENEIIFKEEE